jgi:hypothetical protein
LSASFRVSGDTLLWDLGPYQEGRYGFVLEDGTEVFEMPHSAGFNVQGLTDLSLRIKYESPEGWATYSPQLRLEIKDASTLRWSRRGWPP